MAPRPGPGGAVPMGRPRAGKVVLTVRRDQGSALLLVVGATAALSALALATLSASLLAYEIAVLEHHGAQARLLAVSALDLLGAELASGRVGIPGAGTESVWEPPLPPPPPGTAPLPPGCGFRVRLSLVAGPSGPQTWEASVVPAVLVDALAEANCGRGFATMSARFAASDDGSIFRLF